MTDAPLLVSVREAAQITGIGRDTGFRLVHSGAWPSVRIGRRILVPRAALERWVEEASRSNGERVEQ